MAVRAYAMANREVRRAACSGCGMCAHMCPRGSSGTSRGLLPAVFRVPGEADADDAVEPIGMRIPDLGGGYTTAEVAEAVRKALRTL